MAEERQREADKEQLEKQRLAAILQEIKANRDPYDYSGIPLYGAIIACSIMIQSESACETGSIENISGLGLCATTQLLRNLVGSLHDRHIILCGDNTKIEALSPKSTDSLAYSYFPLQVDWQFAPPADGGTFRDVFRYLNEVIEVRRGTSEYVEAVRKIWWEVSRDEIEHHLRGQLKTYGLPEFNVGDKFREAFDYVLQRFSVPKSRYLIYRVAKNAAALSTRVDFNRGRAINTIPGTLIRDCDRAIADSWNINGYTLKWDTEEPQLFTFLFDRLLGTGIGGFRMTSGQFLEQILHQTLEDERQISKGPDIIQ
jgi:hypothetical protein